MQTVTKVLSVRIPSIFPPLLKIQRVNMANRYFEDKPQSEVYAAFRPTPSIQLIEHVVGFLKEKKRMYDGALSSAIDVSCGTGQTTFLLGPYFDRVLGTDVSPAQIELASKNKIRNIEFQVSPAETIQAANESAQLITVCEAIHWFDIPVFFKECERVLCQNGVLAVFGYGLARLCWKQNPAKDEALNNLLETIAKTTWEKYMHPQLAMVQYEYRDITIPMRDFTRSKKDFIHEREMNLLDYPKYLKSFSTYKNMVAVEGVEKADSVGQKFVQSILEILGDDIAHMEHSSIKLMEQKKYFLLLARK